MGTLNDRQKLFCREYIIDLNATQAAIRAGYSEKTAYSQGQRLLKNVEIKASIDELKSTRSETAEITAQMVVDALACIAFSNYAEEKTRDKLQALSLLGKHLGMFIERSENKTTITFDDEAIRAELARKLPGYARGK